MILFGRLCVNKCRVQVVGRFLRDKFNKDEVAYDLVEFYLCFQILISLFHQYQEVWSNVFTMNLIIHIVALLLFPPVQESLFTSGVLSPCILNLFIM